MGKKSKIYTKTGDDGTTSLVGGNRVKKYDVRLEAYGTVDELNAVIGVVKSFKLPEHIFGLLCEIQNKLFNIGSQLASDEKGKPVTAELAVTEENILFLETAIDELEENLPELTQFILPGGAAAAANCHVARTVCRRTERRILEFAERNHVDKKIIRYINRLSDLLFVLARKINNDERRQEIPWKR